MRLSISKLEDIMTGDTVLVDMCPGVKYRVLEKSLDKKDGGLFNLKLKKNAPRFCVKLEDPTPGFFFSLAEVMEKKNGICELLFIKLTNKIGAYTHD